MSTELAIPAAPSRRALIAADALVQESEQRKLLGQYVAHHMTAGTDFGVIPGTERKDKDGNAAPTPMTLLKPGAEKLTQLFRCIPRFRLEDKVENWETGLFYYRFTCQIVTQSDDAVVAEGVGSCSTYESRYRWRTADRTCPVCGKPAIKKSKFPPREDPRAAPGWYCYGKAGGCGANFDADDEGITSQKTGRVQNPDLIDSINTVLKMAKKRAHVDAAIALARCSDIFTQDVEDFAQPEPPDDSPANIPGVKKGSEISQPPPKSKASPTRAEQEAERDRLIGLYENAQDVGEFEAANRAAKRANDAGLLTQADRDAIRPYAEKAKAETAEPVNTDYATH